MGLISSLRFINEHPLSRGRRLRNLAGFFTWQVGARLVPGPVLTQFVGSAVLFAKPGMTGATGNVYVGLHEFEDMSFVLHALRPDDIFADVGANIGAFTVLASAVVGARSVAFEPADQAYGWLCRNIAINGIGERVRTRQAAVGSKSGTVSFTQNLDSVNHVATDEETEASREVTARIPILTLDEAFGDEVPAIMKIDVEGFEAEVIRGGSRVLGNQRLQGIVMELNGSGARYGHDETALLSRLGEFGFAPYAYAPLERRLSPLGSGVRALPGNVILLRDATAMGARLTDAPRRNVRGHLL